MHCSGQRRTRERRFWPVSNDRKDAAIDDCSDAADTAAVGSQTASDPNDDGNVRDVNADSDVGQSDVAELFEHVTGR